MSPRIRHRIQALTSSAIYRNRLYVFGLALQKGLPVLIVPVIVSVFGLPAYGEYALLFTLVQIYANLSSVAVTQVLVPMWFRQPDPGEFVQRVASLLLVLALAASPLGVAALMLGSATGFELLSPLQQTGWVLLFAFVYNLNALALAVVRAREQRGRFFWSVAIGAGVLLGLIGLAFLVPEAALAHLILAQILALAVATAVMLRGDLGGLFSLSMMRAPATWRPVLQLSAPLCIYTLVVLYAMSVDKWIVKLWFSGAQFGSYVLDYQFAFALMFVPMAIGLHNGPRVSALVAAGSFDLLELEDRKMRRFTLIGSAGIAVIMFAYGRLTHLALTPGYWLLVAGFLCEGLYMLNSNRLMAELQTKRLLGPALLAALLLTGALALAAAVGSIELVYLASPVYFICLFTISSVQLRTLRRAHASNNTRES